MVSQIISIALNLAFIVIFLILKLVFEAQQPAYIFLLTLYGIDTVFTIVLRISRRENIFEAHRLHLFQVAVSKTQMSHLSMSAMYMVIQTVINVAILLIIQNPIHNQLLLIGILLLVLSLTYIIIKKKMMPERI